MLLQGCHIQRSPPGDPVDVGAWPLWRPVNGASDRDTMRHGQPREFCLTHVDAPPVTSDQDARSLTKQESIRTTTTKVKAEHLSGGAASPPQRPLTSVTCDAGGSSGTTPGRIHAHPNPPHLPALHPAPAGCSAPTARKHLPLQPSRKHRFYSSYSRRRLRVTAALCAVYSREEGSSLGDGDGVSSRRLELRLHGCGWS